MEKARFKRKKIPDGPGVYFFIGKRKETLYIGRATSLSKRLGSYFDERLKEKRSALIENMVNEALSIDWLETESVLEAIILEVNLIRTHKPRCNTISKDDKSYNHVVITKEEYPRVLVLRAKDLQDAPPSVTRGDIYGPFPSGKLLRDALKIIQRIFQFYDVKKPLGGKLSKMEKGKIDFNRQIGLYPSEVSKEEYMRTIRHIRLFFQGKKEKVLTELAREMRKFAKREEFENAHQVKRKILALKHIQDVALIKDDLRTYKDDRNIRIEAYDVAHLGGDDMVGVLTVVQNEERDPSSYRKFIIKSVTSSNDPAALKEVLVRRLRHPEWPLPDLIVVDGNSIQKGVAERVIGLHKLFIPVAAVVKDEKHRPKKILGSSKLVHEHYASILLANAEAHRFAISFHRKRRNVLK